MDTSELTRSFTRIGARVRLHAPEPRFRGGFSSGMNAGSDGDVALDVRSDKDGEYFDIAVSSQTLLERRLSVLDTAPKDRHLLLLSRTESNKSKFLCGHDERHWFVAAIPESAPVGTVTQAMEALKPDPVRQDQTRLSVPTRKRKSRKTEAYLRQGEWFFLPMPGLVVPENLILHREPIRRSARTGKPHWAEFCYREPGTTRYVCSQFPEGLKESDYAKLIAARPETRKYAWRTWQVAANVYAKGRIRHADHKTILLPVWHRVLMNTENNARAMSHVLFLD